MLSSVLKNELMNCINSKFKSLCNKLDKHEQKEDPDKELNTRKMRHSMCDLLNNNSSTQIVVTTGCVSMTFSGHTDNQILSFMMNEQLTTAEYK